MILAPFATAAAEYCEAGLAVVPCNGKVPAVLWQNMKRRPSQATVQKWADSKPKANVGALTELSKLTVVDVDHPELLDPAIDEFGETPAIAKTGKGFHLYYLHAGERTLTGFHPGVDIRAAKGFIVLPPSIHPESKKQYAWIEGGPETLADLPQARPGSLPLCGDAFNVDAVAGGFHHKRHDTLYDEARCMVLDCNSHEDFEARLLGLNDALFKNAVEGPLPEAGIKAMAKRVWEYRMNGELVLPRQSYALVRGHEVDQLTPEALYLLTWLRKANKGRNKTFPVSPKGLADEFSWGWQRVSKARDLLLELSLIEKKSGANPRKRIAAHYAFPDPLITDSVNYIKETLPPVSSTSSSETGFGQ